MPISSDFTSIFQHNFEIGFQHCYPTGFLKHTEICNLFQIVAGMHADLGGISYLDMQQHHQAWVLSRMRIEITKVPKWKDVITIKTWIKTLENSRSIRCLEMYLNDEKIVGCETFWVVINTKTRRPDILALPHNHFEKFDTDSISNPIQKINIPEAFTFKNERNILLSDIDIVNHANNVKYLEWCLDVTNVETVLSNTIKALNLNYLQELNFNDAIEIHHTENQFLITKEGKSCFALEIEI
ncbi:acyl-[acyl-carrier-protein] thioesterase [Flavobacterium difficile]|uniref:Acyl-[acyl-carrier-protein] thioesterase n=1 Tax=Flavobacterium difficile TaxID=2709659 RepID=A0ABX0I5L0_9FLAO|nr:acyl-ACP thioesterase domain-containing protein [Flavobacterium difficile]NHM02164.1 acyl-[acyl-carrier-protein] thioesterase [Flavobacterium difficile]